MAFKAVIPQDALVVFTIGTTAKPTVLSTLNKTVSVRVKKRDTTDTPTALGSAAGAAAATAIAVTLDWSLVPPGDYELEAVADVGQTNPVTLIPNETTKFPYLVRHHDSNITA